MCYKRIAKSSSGESECFVLATSTLYLGQLEVALFCLFTT